MYNLKFVFGRLIIIVFYTNSNPTYRFDVNKGYSWQFEVEPAKSVETEAEEKEKKSKKSMHQDPTKVRGTQYQWKRADKILQMTLQRYPPTGMVIVGEINLN